MNYFDSLFSFGEKRFLFEGPEHPPSPPESLPDTPEVPPVPIDNLESNDPEKEKQNESKEVAKASTEQLDKIKADVDLENGMGNIGDAESASNTQENADAAADQSGEKKKDSIWSFGMDKFGETMEKAGKMWEKFRHQLSIMFASTLESMKKIPLLKKWAGQIEGLTDPNERMLYKSLKSGGIDITPAQEGSDDTKAAKRITQSAEKYRNEYVQLKNPPESFHDIAVGLYAGSTPLGKKSTTLQEFAVWIEKNDSLLQSAIREQFSITEVEEVDDREEDEKEEKEEEKKNETEGEKKKEKKEKGKKNKKKK